MPLRLSWRGRSQSKISESLENKLTSAKTFGVTKIPVKSIRHKMP